MNERIHKITEPVPVHGKGQPPPACAERTTPPERCVLLYDGECSLCRSQLRRLQAMVPRDSVEAVSFHDPQVAERFPGLQPEALERALHLVTPDGRVHAGFEAAVKVIAMGRFPGKLALLYYLPGIRWLLDRAYAWIAARRYRLSRSPGGKDVETE